MSNNISNEKILKIVDTFDECAMMYFDGTTNELYENTDITNYNVERPHTNFFECLLKCVGYFLDGDELKVDEEKVEEQIKQNAADYVYNFQPTGVITEDRLKCYIEKPLKIVALYWNFLVRVNCNA